jgi:hypothetical protein
LIESFGAIVTSYVSLDLYVLEFRDNAFNCSLDKSTFCCAFELSKESATANAACFVGTPFSTNGITVAFCYD